MAKNEETPVPEPNWKDRVRARYVQMKKHVRKNEKAYVGGALVSVAVVTFVLTRRAYNLNGILAKKVVIKDSILYFGTFARKQGSPSYLVECLETGQKWLSQLDTARDIGVSPSLLSARFGETNGKVAIIDGLHYVRRAMVVPRSG